MKCPHCGYEDGWNAKKLVAKKGDSGGFFKLQLYAERDNFDSTSRRGDVLSIHRTKKSAVKRIGEIRKEVEKSGKDLSHLPIGYDGILFIERWRLNK